MKADATAFPEPPDPFAPPEPSEPPTPPTPLVGAARDPEFLKTARPWLELYCRYFRSEVTGWEHVPAKGPFLVVGNHSGGQMPPDIPVILTSWWRERGDEEPIYALFHSMLANAPGVGSALAKAGALEAGNDAAEAILDQGGILMVFPGGDYECFRPWRDRNKIEFNGRRGLVRLALRTGVPVVPAVSIGAHETLFVLTRGQALARLMRLDKLMRSKVMPFVLGPPWGLLPVPGSIPTIPLPSKIKVELVEPIDWSERHGPDAADDEDVVTECYEELVATMQATLDRLAAERRFPVLG